MDGWICSLPGCIALAAAVLFDADEAESDEEVRLAIEHLEAGVSIHVFSVYVWWAYRCVRARANVLCWCGSVPTHGCRVRVATHAPCVFVCMHTAMRMCAREEMVRQAHACVYMHVYLHDLHLTPAPAPPPSARALFLSFQDL